MRRLRLGPFENRLAWKLFVLLSGALAIPALVLAVILFDGLAQAQERAREVALLNTARSLGFQSVERLLTAQAQLRGIAARAGDAAPPMPDVPAGSFLAVFRADPGARWQRIDTAPASDDAGGGGDVVPAPPLDPDRLHDLGPEDRVVELASGTAPPAAAAVYLAHRRAGDGLLMLGRIDPARLWDGAAELPPGLWACVHTSEGQPLWCSESAPKRVATAADATPARHAPTAHTTLTRSLFLTSRFDARPWTVTVGVDPKRAEAGLRLEASTIAAVALASVLAAGLLTIWQLRRMMHPLSRMSRATRRWAGGDLEARTQLPRGDEFGELGAAFDHMADQLQVQFRHLAILRSIDGAAVLRTDLDTMLAEVADHVARWPQVASVAVLRRDGPNDRDRWIAAVDARAGTSGRHELGALTRDDIERLQVACGSLGECPATLAQQMERAPSAARIWPVTSGERLLGAVLVWTTGGGPLDATHGSRLVELGTRLAMVLDAVQRESQWRHLARHDSLTGLLNRAGILEVIDAHVARWRSAPDVGAGAFSLLLVDLDRFKQVNDGHGHLAGDQVLRELASRIRVAVGDRGHVGRPGGDEFIVMWRHDGSPDGDLVLAQRLVSALGRPISTPEASFRLGGSVGIARFPEQADDTTSLLRRADLAMFHAKRAGRGRHALFDPQLDEAARRHIWIERELQGAVDREELMLVFQPRVEVGSGRLASFEALVRWVHPTRGVISPGEFVPVAEESALIEHVGDFVVEQACAQLAAWRGTPLDGVRVAVNVSTRQLTSDRLRSRIESALRQHGVAPQALEIEVTESLMADDIDATIARLTGIRALGVSIALDDFGTGYSSMAYLQRLPVDVMKIDRSFVVDIIESDSAQAIARSIIALAGALGKRIVAEGVETEEQARWLADAGVHELQGFLFGRPLPAVELLRRHSVALPAAARLTAEEPSSA